MNALSLILALGTSQFGVSAPAPETADAPAPIDPIDLSAPAATPADASVPPTEGTDADPGSQASLADVGLDDASTSATAADPAASVESAPAESAPLAEPLAPAALPEAPPEPTPAVDAVSANPPPPAPRRRGRTAKRNRTKTPPRELQWRAEVHAGVGVAAAYHASYQMFDDIDRKITMSGLSLVADRRFGRLLFLGGGLGYAGGSTSSNSFLASAETSLKLDEPTVFGRLSLVPVEAIDLYAHLGVGPSVMRITFNESSAALGSAEQTSVTFVGDALLGSMFYLPQRWLPRGGSSRVTGGIDFRVGYTLRGAVAVNPQPTLDEEPIPTMGTEFGKLRAGGLSWNLGLFVRFQ